MTRPQPWTLILFEYLDLPFLLRRRGEPVINARSVQEALAFLKRVKPQRVVVDTNCCCAHLVLEYVRNCYPDTELEEQAQTIERLLCVS